MAIKRFFCKKDTTITNAYKENLITRGEYANMGNSDILEVFSIFQQVSTSSIERSRALLCFDEFEVASARTNELLPSSGSVSFYLRVFNAPHGETLPKKYTLSILPITTDWEEGEGLDMNTYKDEGIANWNTASLGVDWTTPGGDYDAAREFTQYFDTGDEDIEVNITSLMEDWLNGTLDNYGLMLKLSGSYEDGTRERSYYTKKFFARSTEFFYKQPCIEARWNDSFEDHRANFIVSSSNYPASINENTIYMYNYVRGSLINISGVDSPGDPIYVRVYDSASNGTLLSDTAITGGYVSTGIYSASISLYTTSSVVYDRWYNSDYSICYHTGSIRIGGDDDAYDYNPGNFYVTSLLNGEKSYLLSSENRFTFFVRRKNWQPNVYTVATQELNSEIIKDAYYSIYREFDGATIVPYGTGSVEFTKMSFDERGNYFDLDMSLLEPNYKYGISLLYKVNDKYIEQNERFVFRVRENN